MQGVRTTTADPMTEARDKVTLVSFLEEVRGNVEPDKQMLIDGMSAVMTHELGALQMYEQYSQQTQRPDLKEKWLEFGEETRTHAQVAERVISALGGDPSMKSTVAKQLEKDAKNILNVEAKGDQADLIRLGHLLMGEVICKHHWKGVNNLARRVKDPSMAKIFMDASRIVERDEDEHVDWHRTMYDSQLEKVVTGM